MTVFACGPRHPAQTAANANSQQSVTAQPTATTTSPTATTQPTPATTQTAAPTTTQAPTTSTSTNTPPVVVIPSSTAWPPAAIPVDPNLVQQWLKKASEMGVPTPSATSTAPAPSPIGDPIDATIRANATVQAIGFHPAGSIARAKNLKTSEHAGMNFSAQAGKCYMVFGAATSGVTQLDLRVFFPATPPNAVIAEDKSGPMPVLGNATKLCPPVASQFRIDVELLAGSGDVGVQVWEK
jgi:hypothetical protein